MANKQPQSKAEARPAGGLRRHHEIVGLPQYDRQRGIFRAVNLCPICRAVWLAQVQARTSAANPPLK